MREGFMRARPRSTSCRWFAVRFAGGAHRAAGSGRRAAFPAGCSGRARAGRRFAAASGSTTCAPSRNRSPPSVTTISPALEPCGHGNPLAVDHAQRHRPHRDRSIRIHEVDEGAHHAVGRAAANRGVGHDDLIVQHLHQQLDVDELIRKQRAVGVVELRAQLDGAGGHVDSIVDREQLAVGELGAVGAIVGLRRSAGRRHAAAASPPARCPREWRR